MKKIIALALLAFVTSTVVGCGGTTTVGVSGSGVTLDTSSSKR